MKIMLALVSFTSLSACGGETHPAQQVESSGKSEVALAEVPPDVPAAARPARPGFTPIEAESEMRGGRRYFDIGGTLPDGSEVEFDVLEESGRWQVVETQHDIAFARVPEQVRRAMAAHDAAFAPTRVIESTQADGLVVYELFGPQGEDPQGRKIEVSWGGANAERLTAEWAH